MAKLMIVDDEKDVCDFAANFFRKRKIEVVIASGGEDAIMIYDMEKPDLVLLDINMATIDGIETLKKLKANDNNAKIIMVTGKRPEEDDAFKKCKELGALDYIHKPLELRELEKVVMEALK